MERVETHDRVAKNEVLFRDVNERVKAIDEEQGVSAPNGTWDFLCECRRADCLERVSLTPAEYELVRSSPVQFAVVPGHVLPEVERVVHESDRFFVVEKLSGEQEIARATDPRA